MCGRLILAGGEVKLMGGGGAKCPAGQSKGSLQDQVTELVSDETGLILNEENEVCQPYFADDLVSFNRTDLALNLRPFFRRPLHSEI